MKGCIKQKYNSDEEEILGQSDKNEPFEIEENPPQDLDDLKIEEIYLEKKGTYKSV
jgi:hypothetical protein